MTFQSTRILLQTRLPCYLSSYHFFWPSHSLSYMQSTAHLNFRLCCWSSLCICYSFIFCPTPKKQKQKTFLASNNAAFDPLGIFARNYQYANFVKKMTNLSKLILFICCIFLVSSINLFNKVARKQLLISWTVANGIVTPTPSLVLNR